MLKFFDSLQQFFKANAERFYTGATYLNSNEHAPFGSLSFDELDNNLKVTKGLMNILVSKGIATGDSVRGYKLLDPNNIRDTLTEISKDPRYNNVINDWMYNISDKYAPLIGVIREVVKRNRDIDQKPAKLHALGKELSKTDFAGQPDPNATLTHFFAFSPDPQQRGAGLLYRDPDEITNAISVHSPNIRALGASDPHSLLGQKAVKYANSPEQSNLFNTSMDLISIITEPSPTSSFDSPGAKMARNAIGAMGASTGHRAGTLGKAVQTPRALMFRIEELFNLFPDRAVDLCYDFIKDEPELKETLKFSKADLRSLKRTITSLYLMKKGKVSAQELRKSYSVIDRTPIDPNILPHDDRKRKRTESGRPLDEPISSSYAEEVVTQYPDSEFIDILMLRVALDNYVEERRAQ